MYNPDEYWKNELGGSYMWKNHARTSPAIQKSIERVRNLIIPEMIKRKTGNGGIIDAGCGSGYAIKTFQESGLWDKYYGVDFQQHRIDYCKETYGTEDIEFHCTNLNALPIPDKSIATIYTGAVLMHIPVKNKILVINEFKRVLNDDGFYFGHEVVENLHEIYDTGNHVINTNLHWLQKQFDPFKVEVVELEHDNNKIQMIYAHK